MRWLFTVEEAVQIPVFRFLCPACGRTMCVLPGFVEANHQSAVDVKEAVVHAAAFGRSLPEIAEESKTYAAEDTRRRHCGAG
jgi:transposase